MSSKPPVTTEQKRDDLRQYVLEEACRIRQIDRRSVNNRIAASMGRDDLFLQDLEEALKRTFKKNWATPKTYTGKKAKHTERVHSAFLSDLHFGAQLDPREVPLEFGPIQESRRFGKVAVQIADYKRQYRKESRLILNLMGDIIQNQLHDAREGTTLTSQFAAAVHYLLQLVMFVAAEYPQVDVYCVPGNHGRLKTRHWDRAVQQKWDSVETMIYAALRFAVAQSKVPNVNIHIGQRPYYIVEIFDKKGFITHGDTVLKPGYPGRSINVQGLYQQICKWNASRHIDGPFDMFAVGHVHFGSITNMPGNIVMLTNGCLVPPDPFALSIGSPDVSCGQYLIESVRGHIVGDQRFIRVDDADAVPEYNKVITPFSEF